MHWHMHCKLQERYRHSRYLRLGPVVYASDRSSVVFCGVYYRSYSYLCVNIVLCDGLFDKFGKGVLSYL